MSKSTIQRGATTLLNEMQRDGRGKYAMVESIGGEPPHAAVVVATDESPAFLRALLRLVKRHTARPRSARSDGGGTT